MIVCYDVNRMQKIIGQAQAIKVLQAGLRTQRLHHAYLFHGPSGVGKFTTALAFGKTLLCQDRQTDLAQVVSACGQCKSCKLIGRHGSGTPTAHPDLHVVTKELARYSDDANVRQRKLTTIPVQVLHTQLIEPVYRTAQLGDHKVFIVDEAHLLDLSGQNRVLKTLEEPPSQTYVILVTDKYEKLLPTLRSRCLNVAFMSLADEHIDHWLDQQDIDLSDEQRPQLIGFAAGSLGQAKLVLDYDLLDWPDVMIDALDQMQRQQYPVGLGQWMAQAIDSFAKQWVQRHENASKEAANKQASQLMWAMIAQLARQRLSDLAPNCDPGNLLSSQALLSPWLGVIDALGTVQREQNSHVNIGLVTDHLVSLMYRALSEKSAVVHAS